MANAQEGTNSFLGLIITTMEQTTTITKTKVDDLGALGGEWSICTLVCKTYIKLSGHRLPGLNLEDNFEANAIALPVSRE
jgi:hypothetical protein